MSFARGEYSVVYGFGCGDLRERRSAGRALDSCGVLNDLLLEAGNGNPGVEISDYSAHRASGLHQSRDVANRTFGGRRSECGSERDGR